MAASSDSLGNEVRHLFLDLEDTATTANLNGWFNVQLGKVGKIRADIERFQPHQVSIFSFALSDDEEVRRFRLALQADLERALGIKIIDVPNVDTHIKGAACRAQRIQPELVKFSDMVDFWGKHQAFRLFVKDRFSKEATAERPIVVRLIDDAVEDEEFAWPRLHIRGSLVNVDRIAL